MSVVDDVAATLAQLTDEQLSAAIQQADEHQYSHERVPLDLDMAVARLRAVRDHLQQALSSNSFALLPPTIQRDLMSLLSAVSTHVTGLVGGEDTLDALVADTDALDAYAWRNRIAEHAQFVSELTAAQTQLAGLVAETQKLKDDVSAVLAQTPDLVALTQQAQEAAAVAMQSQQTAQGAQEQVAELAQQAGQAATSAAEAQQAAQAASEQAGQAAQQSREAADGAGQARQSAQEALQAASQSAQQAQTAQTEATERNTNINTLLGQAQASRQQIAVVEAELKALQDAGEEFRQKMADTESQAKAAMAEARQNADSVITDNSQRTEALLTELKANEDRIEDALQKATGVSLFHSFHQSQGRVGARKWVWAFFAGVLGLGTVAWVGYLTTISPAITLAVYFKLGVAIPVGLLVWFCIAQYNHERRLEEEYAFKSNISLSLVPYKDLVATGFSSEDEASKSKYAQFLVDSVEKVFTPPVGRRADIDLSALKSLGTEQLRQLTELLTAVAKVVRGG